VLTLLLAIAGCTSRAAPSPAAQSSAPDDAGPVNGSRAEASGFGGTIRLPDEPPQAKGKQFTGAWIELDGGERWVIDYASESPFRVLGDRRVRVEGEPYEPKNQALVAKHFRVRSLVVIGRDAADAPLVRVGEQRRLHGRFSEITYPPGTKLAGEKSLVFVEASGKTYQLEHVPAGGPTLGAQVTIDAHDVEPSPHAAHVGGPYLWVRSIEGETN
jgi:hypothetical protein